MSTLRQRIATWHRHGAWLPLAPLVGACLGVVALFGIPVTLYWTLLYEPLWLFAAWPLVAGSAFVAFWSLGALRHGSTGLWCYAPRAALAGVSGLAMVTGLMVLRTAAEWPPWVAYTFLAILPAASWFSAAGVQAYRESWRRGRQGRSVAATVRRTLTRAPAAHARQAAATLRRHGWGSLHCLHLVRAHRDQCRARLLHGVSTGTTQDAFDAYLAAASTLSDYLAGSAWPEGTFDPAQRAAEMLQVTREQLILCLWFTAVRPPATGRRRVTLARETLDRLFEQIAAASEEDPLTRLLHDVAAVCVGRTPPPATSRTEIDYIRQTLASFDAIVARRHANEARIAADTWLALSARLRPALRRDVWLAMTQRAAAAPAEISRLEAAFACGAHARVAVLENWIRSQPDSFTSGLAAQFRRAREDAGASIAPEAAPGSAGSKP